MSNEVKRYRAGYSMAVVEDPQGPLVLAADFDRVAADLRRSREALDIAKVGLRVLAAGGPPVQPWRDYATDVLERCTDAALSGKETP